MVVDSLVVWTQVAMHLLQDLSVQRINARLPFAIGVLWEFNEEGKLVRGFMVSGCHKFDNCGRINE